MGDWRVYEADDGWTVLTHDGSLAARAEHGADYAGWRRSSDPDLAILRWFNENLMKRHQRVLTGSISGIYGEGMSLQTTLPALKS